MKNKTTLIAMALLLLALLAPHRLCAETKHCPFDNPRAREIWDNAPQTPEAFLRMIKSLMDDPHLNGFDFGEKILGVDRAYWGPPGVAGSKKEFSCYNVPSLRPQKGSRRKWFDRPTPYSPTGGICIENDRFAVLNVFRSDKAFCLNPVLTRNILGEPEHIAQENGMLTMQYVKNRIRFHFPTKRSCFRGRES